MMQETPTEKTAEALTMRAQSSSISPNRARLDLRSMARGSLIDDRKLTRRLWQ
jgi:hypothetical protein